MKALLLLPVLLFTMLANGQSGNGTYKSNGYMNCTWDEASNKLKNCKPKLEDAVIEISTSISKISIVTTSTLSYNIIRNSTKKINEEDVNYYYLVTDKDGNYFRLTLEDRGITKELKIVSCDKNQHPVFYNGETNEKQWLIM